MSKNPRFPLSETFIEKIELYFRQEKKIIRKENRVGLFIGSLQSSDMG